MMTLKNRLMLRWRKFFGRSPVVRDKLINNYYQLMKGFSP